MTHAELREWTARELWCLLQLPEEKRQTRLEQMESASQAKLLEMAHLELRHQRT